MHALLPTPEGCFVFFFQKRRSKKALRALVPYSLDPSAGDYLCRPIAPAIRAPKAIAALKMTRTGAEHIGERTSGCDI